MSRYTFILSCLALTLGSCCLCAGIEGYVDVTRIKAGHAAVDTAIARGWIVSRPAIQQNTNTARVRVRWEGK